MKVLVLWIPFLVGMLSVTLISCDKIGKVVDEVKKIVKDNKEEDTGPSQEEIAQSDAAVARYLDELERVPRILAKVIDEETAFKARAEVDKISHKIVVLREDLIPLSNEAKQKLLTAKTSLKNKTGKRNTNSTTQTPPDKVGLEGGVHWYIKEENQEAYEDRVRSLVHRIIAQILRIESLTRESPVALHVTVSGILLLADVENGGRPPGEIREGAIKPMPKDWMPPGVTSG